MPQKVLFLNKKITLNESQGDFNKYYFLTFPGLRSLETLISAYRFFYGPFHI